LTSLYGAAEVVSAEAVVLVSAGRAKVIGTGSGPNRDHRDPPLASP
jgi:hypothetical protein